jgi:hypothetical protein
MSSSVSIEFDHDRVSILGVRALNSGTDGRTGTVLGQHRS